MNQLLMVGAGSMSEALVRGWIDSGIEPAHIEPSQLEEASGLPAVCAMPNTPIAYRSGMTGLWFGPETDEADRAKALLSLNGSDERPSPMQRRCPPLWLLLGAARPSSMKSWVR